MFIVHRYRYHKVKELPTFQTLIYLSLLLFLDILSAIIVSMDAFTIISYSVSCCEWWLLM